MYSLSPQRNASAMSAEISANVASQPNAAISICEWDLIMCSPGSRRAERPTRESGDMDDEFQKRRARPLPRKAESTEPRAGPTQRAPGSRLLQRRHRAHRNALRGWRQLWKFGTTAGFASLQ